MLSSIAFESIKTHMKTIRMQADKNTSYSELYKWSCLNQFLWPQNLWILIPTFPSEPQIYQASLLSSSKKGSQDSHLENVGENPLSIHLSEAVTVKSRENYHKNNDDFQYIIIKRPCPQNTSMPIVVSSNPLLGRSSSLWQKKSPLSRKEIINYVQRLG